MRHGRSISVIMALVLSLMLLPAREVQANTYTVTTTADSGDGSLRWAIEQANTNPGADTIEFDFPLGGVVYTIQPESPLPMITDDETTIDGYTQGGASPATADTPADIQIEIDGSSAGVAYGLAITSTNNVIRGLAIINFTWDGIAIAYESATDNVIAGNYLGIDPNGNDDGNGHSGVYVGLGAQDNLIGGDTPAERNVLSGNEWSGAEIHGSGTTSNTVAGNYIGTDATGTANVPNTLYGVRIYGGAQRNTVGGETDGDRNIISGNTGDGVRIVGADTMSNTVAGNYIGTTLDGATALANGLVGVRVRNGAQYNIIGGETPGERNVISGNIEDGVCITGTITTTHNSVSGNYIGTTVGGASVVANGHSGVLIDAGAQYNTIGPDNVISGNTEDGVTLEGEETVANSIAGNFIGTDASGTIALANGGSGVSLSDARYNDVGGYTVAERNVISGNDRHGVYLDGGNVEENDILGNYIGASADGMSALGNDQYGVFLKAGEYNQIEGNVISANEHGVVIGGGAWNVNSNTIITNTIGVAADGASPLGSTENGVYIRTLGRSNDVVDNHIAHNGNNGVQVSGSSAFDNRIVHNSIHDNDALGICLTRGNYEIDAPTIEAVDPGSMTISGTTCSGCWVEVFASQDGDGEGEIWLGQVVADSSAFELTISSLPYPYLTATTTNSEDDVGTSEFSEVFTASLPALSTSTKTVTAPHPMPGQPLTYTITLTNTGTDASSAKLTDTLPAEVAWTDDYSVSTGTLTWDDGKNRLLWNGTVSVDTSATIVYRVTVSETVTDGTTITNTATVDDGLFNVHELGPARVTMDFESVYLPLVMRN